MAATIKPTPVHRATLLIAYGRFGHAVLRRFLNSTAARGVLVWEESREPDSNERRLRDLALLYLPDPSEETSSLMNNDDKLDGNSIELMRDLYQQIETIEKTDAPNYLGEAMEAKAKVLLDVATRAARDKNLPLGLDVIVLVRPRNRSVTGQLKPLLDAGLSHLHRYTTQLQRQVTGANALNFIQILDFENYWQQSEPGKQMREAVCSYVEHWQDLRSRAKPSFGRIYLVDGHTPDGIRDERQRIDEISLFLEFLLFEGQRDGDLQTLYQAQAMDDSIVASFGIRLLERSAGLLKRLAAAYFGMGWLNYLANAQNQVAGTETRKIHELMASFHKATLARAIQTETLANELNQHLAVLMQEMEALSIEDSNWSMRVQECYESAVRRIKSELGDHAHAHIQHTLNQAPFIDLATSLEHGIEQALHHDRYPLTLAVVINEIDRVLQAMEQKTPEPIQLPAAATPIANNGLKALQEDYQAYQLFRSRQLNASGVQRWWPLFGFLLSLGLSPIVASTLANLSDPDPNAFWLVRQVQALLKHLADYPVAMTVVLGLMFWGLLALLVQPGINQRIKRARQFWIDAERGRLIGRLRKLLRPDGELGATLTAFLAQIQQGIISSVQGEAVRELGVVKKCLSERQREVNWLRRQLREFLMLHGLDPGTDKGTWNRVDHEKSGIRHALENYTDFQRILQANPPEAERFLSMQAHRQPFKNWNEQYNQIFLYPLRFIDDLSEEYRDPLETELSRPGTGQEQNARAEELKAILKRHGDFASAFYWRPQDGMPPDRFFCLLPIIWQSLPGVADTLDKYLGIPLQNQLLGENVERAYLLRVKTGVKTTCLT